MFPNIKRGWTATARVHSNYPVWSFRLPKNRPICTPALPARTVRCKLRPVVGKWRGSCGAGITSRCVRLLSVSWA